MNLNNSFGASDWFDINFFANYIQSENKIKSEFTNSRFKLDNNILSSRLLNHWYSLGIINDDRPDGKGWKKFSFSELVWIYIALKLRKFNVDLKKIKNVKDQLDKYNKYDKKSNCLLLEFYMLVAIYSKIPVKIVVFESGQAEILRQVDLDMANQLDNINEDYLSIDLNRLLNSLIKEKDIKANYLISKEVYKSRLIEQLEDSISADNIQSVTIKIKDQNYIVDEKFFMKDRAKANSLMSVLKYGELIEKKNSGKSTFEITNKKKIKRDTP